jgi:signal transduction histidine kinase
METPSSPLRRLFGGMIIAAYVTWAAVFVLLIDAPLSRFGGNRSAAIACLWGFLAAVVLKQLVERPKLNLPTALLLAAEGVLALMVCLLWRDTYAPILAIVFMADCAMVLGARALIGVAIGTNVALWAISVYVWHINGAWRLILAYGGFQLFAALTAWYSRRADETAAQLRETNAHLMATRSLLEESARDHERLRLARELHDVAGHKLTALKLNLTALQRDAGGAPNVDTAAHLATELLADIRGVVAQMRQHDGLDIRAALTQLIAPLPAPPRIHLVIHEDARLASVAQAEALLRVVQEALTNVVRHAGARNVWVELVREAGNVHLRVHDDGKAELPLEEGFGLAGMRERLAQLSGQLDISRAAPGGLALDLLLPLNP